MLLCFLIGTEVTPGADWPNWRGPRYNDVSQERSGWPKGWPPKLLWQASVGKGSTSPVIAAGRVYVMGWQESRGSTGRDTVYCFDAATGKALWRQQYQSPYQGRWRLGDTDSYGGPSSTPAYDHGTRFLYTLGIDGDLRCWDTAKGGRAVWALNLYDRYKIGRRPVARRGQRDYGYTSSPLIQGKWVVVEAGAKAGLLIAFDKKTGRELWTSESKIPAGHNGGPVPMTVEGIPCVVSLALKELVVVRLDAQHPGGTLASHPWATDFANNIATPAIAGKHVIVTSGYNQSCMSLLSVNRGGIREVWRSRSYSKVSSPLVHEGRIFFVEGSLRCHDLKTGKRVWRGGRFNRGSCLLTAGDKKLVVYGAKRLALVDPKADKYRELSRVDNVGRSTCYPHVALAGGVIVCKDMDGHLSCFSIKPR